MDTIFTSFKELFEQVGVSKIEIPKIQRAYAQGRRDSRTGRTRERFLSAIYDKISLGQPITLDFVYGDLDKNSKTLIPLDGQQRLTTLFLLHWYAAKKEDIAEVDHEFLHNFTYNTRPSARSFCEKLISFQPSLLLPLSAEIENQTWFPLEWKRDATIDSMLCMLDAIQVKFAQVDNLWEKLGYIRFYFKPIEDMGLTDDIYIKMNSRGKPLTDFEHFKAELEKTLKLNDEALANRISRKIDIEWTDLLWQFRIEGDVIDDYFLRYFRFICDIICYKNNASPKINDVFDLLKHYFEGEQAKNNILLLESFFDCWIEVDEKTNRKSSIDIAAFFDNFVSEDSNHETGKFVSDYDPNLLKDCITTYADVRGNGNRKFNLNKIILLYGFICYRIYNLQNKENTIKDEDFRRRIRIVNNLIKNSADEITDSEQRVGGNRMPAILSQVDSIIQNGIISDNIVICEQENKINFNQHQLVEERNKLVYTKEHPEVAEKLFELEDHSLLYGQIGIVGLSDDTLYDKFIQLFECDWDKVDCAMLALGDYSQRDKWWRIQLGSRNKTIGATAWKKLFHKSSAEGYEQTQAVLQALLSKPVINDESLDAIINSFLRECEEKNLYLWRYYYCKYQNFRVGRYGKYTQTKDKPYCLVSIFQQEKESQNSYQVFLNEIGEVSRDSCGNFIDHETAHIACRNDGFYLINNDTEEVLDSKIIEQNEDGVDTENRVLLGTEWYEHLKERFYLHI